MIKKSTIWIMGLVTLFGMGSVGLLLIYFFVNKDLSAYFSVGLPWYYQIVIGLIYGSLSAILGWGLIKSNLLTEVRTFYSSLVKQLNLNFFYILFLSFAAGVGEELLFRGGIQPFLGLWLTSIIFVAIHGYLNPKNWKLSIYGALMVFIIVGIGNMYEKIGPFSAMSAHFAIDVILLSVMKKNS